MIPKAKMPAVILLLLVSTLMLTACGWNPDKPDEERQALEETIAAFKKKDPGIKTFFNEAYGYAVFPSVGKGGWVIGGAYGTGKVFRHGQIIGSTSIVQGTIGFQLGGQVYSEIVFFKDKKAFDRFKSGRLEFDAQVSAIAVTLGAAAKAAYEKGIAVFVMTKGGLMYEASVGGQSFTFTPEK
jgi:lipid-binding SYLF domain-containing protein